MERNRSEIISMLTDQGLIAVVRARSSEQITPLSEALISGGITAIEITMTTPDAIGAIRKARQAFGSRALIGVGTVLNAETCQAALQAGAEFVVTPVCRTELVRLAHGAGRPIMLGSYSPTEAQTAHEAGADFIKIFPADTLGPAYIKALLAPLPHLRLVPTGGLDLHNIRDFMKAGCAAVGLGSSLVSSSVLQNSAWPELTLKAGEFVRAFREIKR
jgi:2-dehydro-3-deoxyphosphogluconate aldolase/(4S)-4-hydroxy-2-oxoglutarate aldolase